MLLALLLLLLSEELRVLRLLLLQEPLLLLRRERRHASRRRRERAKVHHWRGLHLLHWRHVLLLGVATLRHLLLLLSRQALLRLLLRCRLLAIGVNASQRLSNKRAKIEIVVAPDQL